MLKYFLTGKKEIIGFISKFKILVFYIYYNYLEHISIYILI